MLQTSLLLMKSLNKTETPIFLSVVCSLFPKAIFLTFIGTCIDIKEIWFRIANGQMSSMFDRAVCPQHDNGGVLSFYVFIS